MARQKEYFHGPVLNLPYSTLATLCSACFLGTSSGQHWEGESAVRPEEDSIPARSDSPGALRGAGGEGKGQREVQPNLCHAAERVLVLHRPGLQSSFTF